MNRLLRGLRAGHAGPEQTVHPVDEVLPLHQLAALGLQHVLVMYAGAIAVPLIIGGALKLSKGDTAFLIAADLFCCGVVTIIQSMGIGKIGIRLPMMMGVSFTAIAPFIAAGSNPELGLRAVFGGVITAGVLLIVLSCLPKLAVLAASIPQYVLGGAALVMFGMVAVTGVRILGQVDFVSNKRNAYVLALSLGLGMIPLVSDRFFAHLPDLMARFFQNGILLGTFSAVLLNLFFSLRSEDSAATDAAAPSIENQDAVQLRAARVLDPH